MLQTLKSQIYVNKNDYVFNIDINKLITNWKFYINIFYYI